MKSTRERILQTLLNHPQATISEIAKSVDINTISARHHLTNLQLDGLVKTEEVRHGVGRPRLVYSLTEDGAEKFPTRYLQLTNRLLSQLKQRLPETEIVNIFSQMAKDIASEKAESTKKLTIEEKLNYIQNNLTDQGFSIEWEKVGEKYKINEISCPFYHIAQLHSEVCLMNQTLISSILSVPAERIECILDGDNQCSYLITQEKEALK